MEKKFAKFLRPTYGCEADNEKIIKQLKKIIGNESDKTKIAKKIFLWVRDNIRYELDPVLGAVNVLERNTGACVDKSSLFIALCRAAGIPARYVFVTAELITKKDIDFTQLQHCSTEILLNGQWKIVDPTFDPSLLSIFPQATFDSVNWWDPIISIIDYRPVEIDKKLMDLITISYENNEINLKFKDVITKERP